MAGKVVDYLLSVADEQANLPERVTPANIKAKYDLHWFDIKTANWLVEFQFLVLAKTQSKVATAICSQLKEFVTKESKFHPTEILIYSTSQGLNAGEYIT